MNDLFIKLVENENQGNGTTFIITTICALVGAFGIFSLIVFLINFHKKKKKK